MRRLAREEGQSLIELLIVILLMGIIFGPLIGGMVSAMNAQARQLDIVTAQEQARLALQRMREDIHCAHSVGAPTPNASGGETIIFNETNTTGTAECPGLLEQNATAVQWCSVPVSGTANRYRVYRESNPENTCDGGSSTLQVDYITGADVWSLPTCTGGEYPTVAVSLPVDVSPSSPIEGTYNLSDSIALRNANTC